MKTSIVPSVSYNLESQKVLLASLFILLAGVLLRDHHISSVDIGKLLVVFGGCGLLATILSRNIILGFSTK